MLILMLLCATQHADVYAVRVETTIIMLGTTKHSTNDAPQVFIRLDRDTIVMESSVCRIHFKRKEREYLMVPTLCRYDAETKMRFTRGSLMIDQNYVSANLESEVQTTQYGVVMTGHMRQLLFGTRTQH